MDSKYDKRVQLFSSKGLVNYHVFWLELKIDFQSDTIFH